MRLFKIGRSFTVHCEHKPTRNGFEHEATLINRWGYPVFKCKQFWCNRTWECYEFETVLKLIRAKANLTRSQAKSFDRLLSTGNN